MASRPVHSRLTAFRRFAAGGAALALALSLAGVTAATPGAGASSSRIIYMPTLGQSHGSHGHGPGGGGTKTNNLLYNGGSVETAPNVVLVYWDWAAQPDGAAQTYVNGFFGAIAGTGWEKIDTQYYCDGGTGFCANKTFIGTGTTRQITTDGTTVPSKPTQSEIATVALNAAYKAGYPANTTFVVLTPSKHSMNGFAHQWCAWHSSTTAATGQTVAYAYLPYQPDAGTNCGMNYPYVTGASSPYYEGYSIVGGHEYAEAVTDPYPSSGWLDSSGSEIGDKCAWTLGPMGTIGNGYTVQSLWSNLDSGCTLG